MNSNQYYKCTKVYAIECPESREQLQKQIILMEDIKNYKKCKEELSEYCEKRGFTDNIIKEQIIFYMNDYSPCIYGISKNNYKKIKRLVAFRIKEKKYIYLYSLILNNDNNPKTEINRYLGCLTVDERNTFMKYIIANNK
jgi:hypothetical protein